MADEYVGAARGPRGQDTEWSIRHRVPLSHSHLTEEGPDGSPLEIIQQQDIKRLVKRNLKSN